MTDSMLPKGKEWLNPQRAMGDMDAAWDAAMIIDRPLEAYAGQLRSIRQVRLRRFISGATSVGALFIYAVLKATNNESLMPVIDVGDLGKGDSIAMLAGALPWLSVGFANIQMRANYETAQVIRAYHPGKAGEFDVIDKAYEARAPKAIDRVAIDRRVTAIRTLHATLETN